MLAVFLREHVSNLVGMLKMYFYGESKIPTKTAILWLTKDPKENLPT